MGRPIMLHNETVLESLQSPFPGLRPFQIDEALKFFGREAQIEELLQRLATNRLVAIVGTSGCGKSSLVRAGLIPALYRGYLSHTTSRWRFVVLRPGAAPISQLADVLRTQAALPINDTQQSQLKATSAGLSTIIAESCLQPGENLLIVVDQFEELFTFGQERTTDEQAEAELFVSALLHAVEQWDTPIYVVLTMRSDFLGDCARFPGLPEALTRSQYLVPQLTREQRRDAIVRPLRLVGIVPSARLVQQVLNDAGDDPSSLPIMQHALARTFGEWRKTRLDDGDSLTERGELDLSCYNAVGGIDAALERHGNEILDSLLRDDYGTVEKIFRALTVTVGNRTNRRPTKLRMLYDIVEVTSNETERVNQVLTTFARREHSFLSLSSNFDANTIVDITHESLITKWPVLASWAKEEARSAEWYGDLVRDVIRHRTGDAGLWRDPDLSRVVDRRDREGWNAGWARQYSPADSPSFDDVTAFLEASATARDQESKREIEQRDKALNDARMLASARRRTSYAIGALALVLLAGALLLLGGAVQYYRLYQNLHDGNVNTVALLDTQRALTQSRAQVSNIESQLLALKAEQQPPAKTSPPSSEDRAALQQQIDRLSAEKTKLQESERAARSLVDKIRVDQSMNASDSTAILARVDSLQNELNRALNEKNDLQSRLDALQRSQAQRPPETVMRPQQPSNALETEEPQIRRVLVQYAEAYHNRDLKKLAEVFPSYVEKSGKDLQEVFRQIDTFTLTVTDVSPVLLPDLRSAIVKAKLQESFSGRKIPSRTNPPEQRSFYLEKLGGRWLIVSMQ
jgi:energy-coupling factor transporter ATP-binding protein EcfA2